MKETTEDTRPILFLYSPDRDYVRPYFERLLPEYRLTASPEGADYGVMISSTDIYDVDEGENFNEFTPVRQHGKIYRDENIFDGLCRQSGLCPTVLRCADIICTGMDGRPRKLAEDIYRGRFIAIKDNPARRSVVHAVSIPEAASAVMRRGGVYNVTDGIAPTLNDLAEAMAWRISQKRIFSINAKWMRLLAGRKKMAEMEKSITFSCEKIYSTGDYKPVPVTEYLKTHVYDEQSL